MKWMIPFMWAMCRWLAWVLQFIGISGLLILTGCMIDQAIGG